MIKAINKMKNNKGFTLVELIVVIAVLGILAAISVPKLMGVLDDAKVKADKASAINIAKAAEMYIQLNEKTTIDTLTDDTDFIELTTQLATKNYISDEENTNFDVKVYKNGTVEIYKNGDLVTPIYTTQITVIDIE